MDEELYLTACALLALVFCIAVLLLCYGLKRLARRALRRMKHRGE